LDTLEGATGRSLLCIFPNRFFPEAALLFVVLCLGCFASRRLFLCLLTLYFATLGLPENGFLPSLCRPVFS